MAKLIPVGHDVFTIVDDGDFEWLSLHRWHLNGAGSRSHVARYAKGNSTILMHREVMGFPRQWVDHRDRNPLNNQKSNLRICPKKKNNTHNRKPVAGSVSKYKGVTRRKGYDKWIAQIGMDGKVKYLGIYDSEEAAARAYDAVAREYQGEFAYLNFPEN